jgi:hypothetical protein
MQQEDGKCSFFIIPKLLDVFCILWKAVSATLALFLHL